MENNKEKQRFEKEIDGNYAYVEYQLNGKTYDLTHTEVPEALQGKGAAGKLVKDVFNYIEEKGYTLKPSCSYIKHFIDKHPEYKKLVAS